MSNLKEEIKKIYEFVNIEFNINDKEELEAIKDGLGIEKIETLDIMLNDYKKAVNKALRREKQKQAQAKFKKIGTNLKLEEFERYENDAKSKNLTISEYVKKCLEGFIGSKTVEAVKVPIEIDLKPYKQDIARLKAEIETLKDTKSISKNNEVEKLENEIIKLEKATIKRENEMLKIRENFAESQRVYVDRLKTKEEEVEKLLNRNMFQRILNIKVKEL